MLLTCTMEIVFRIGVEFMKCYDYQDLFRHAPELNYEVGMKYFLGNMVNYRKGILSCIKSIEHKLPILCEMYETKDYDGLAIIAKNLSSLLNNIGAIEISKILYKMEELELNKSFEELSSMLHSYILELENLSGNLKALATELEVSLKQQGFDNESAYHNYQEIYASRIAK